MFENIIYVAYDFNINVNKALVRELEGTACAYRCWKRHDDGLARGWEGEDTPVELSEER